MITCTASELRSNIYRVIDDVAESHHPVIITSKRNNVVLVAEDDWKAIQETLYLLSIPGMRDSIQEGMKTPLDECDDDLKW